MLTIDLFEDHNNEPVFIQALRDFLPVALKVLNLKQVPKIVLKKELHNTNVPTFGRFTNEEKVVYCVINNRHPNDILRTLAHELAHYGQGQEHELSSGSWHTGSPVENDAHVKASIIMRHFNTQFPKYLKAAPIILPDHKVEEEWSKKYKDSIDCSNPKGFSQKAHCAGKKKHTNVAEGGSETSWSNDADTITLQDILELTKHIKQINLPINDNLKNKLIHWDGNPEEIERINQVTVSNQFPILVMVDEQGQINWILDGNHRLHKAIQSQAKTIPAKLIKPSDLSDKAKRIFQTEGKHCDAKNAVPELKAALTKRKTELKNSSAKVAYDKIDKIMTRIAQTYNISGQELHDLWTERYGEIPDTWVLDESKETRQALSDQDFEFPQQGQYGYRQGYKGRGVLELADGRTGKIINLGEFGDFDDDYKPNQKWLRIVFTNPNMDDDAWAELEDMLWSENQVSENFADGKGPGRPGDSQRHGIPKGATISQLEKASHSAGRKGQLARWQLNMRRGHKK